MSDQRRRVMPNGRLFYSPLGLFDFQIDAVVDTWAHGCRVGIIDLGLGKTVIGLALACQLIEAGEIDQVIMVGKGNKLKPSEFPKDLDEFTSLNWVKYHGTGRQKRLEKAQAKGHVDLVLTTYETAKVDLMVRDMTGRRTKNKSRGLRADGPLMSALDIRNRRTLWIFDEVIKLGSRRAETWQAFDYALREARKHNRQRVLGLHANGMTIDYEQALNIGLIIAPDAMPTITEFENRCTYGRNDYGRYSFNREVDTWFIPMFQAITFRKRATDPDVISQYPKLIEKTLSVELEPAQRDFYEAVGQLYGDKELSQEEEDQLRNALRLSLGHPRAHLRSRSEISAAIVSTLGEEGLRAIPSSKTKALIEHLRELVEQGKQVLVFTWYANTVLPEVSADLTAADIDHAVYLAEQSQTATEDAKAAFKSGRTRVLLSSDAGAEGLNLPEADVIIEYDGAHTYERRSQRFGRGTRLTSDKHFVYAQTMVCENTLDQGQLRKVIRRNALQDTLLGDTGATGHKSAAQRMSELMGA